LWVPHKCLTELNQLGQIVGDTHRLSKGDITCKRPRTKLALANLTISNCNPVNWYIATRSGRHVYVYSFVLIKRRTFSTDTVRQFWRLTLLMNSSVVWVSSSGRLTYALQMVIICQAHSHNDCLILINHVINYSLNISRSGHLLKQKFNAIVSALADE
jgi:hypothetical protein